MTGTTNRPATPAATVSMTLDSDGRERSATVHVPALPAGVTVPLVLVLHGAGSDAARFEAKTGYDQLADDDRFIAVYPDGLLLGAGSAATRTWNAGSCCGAASATNAPDVMFLVSLLDQLEVAYPVDVHRVYAVGHSNGAMMAERLGCEQASRFAAIASVAGSLELRACAPSTPVAMMEIHGTADSQVSIGSAVRAVTTWRGADLCATDASVVTAGVVTTQSWNCAQGATVRFVEITGADHPWPGGLTPPPSGQTASDALDASEVTWTFLSAYTRA
jgi:polyhydroxybutyrate depolymerase